MTGKASKDRVFAIDPGTFESGYAIFNGEIIDSGVLPNEELIGLISTDRSEYLAIESFQAQGAPIDGNSVTTIRWEGRFQQAWPCPEEVLLIARRKVKSHLCGKGTHGDPEVRAALIELLGPPGVKAQPGPTYGVKSHAWHALGVAVTAHALYMD